MSKKFSAKEFDKVEFINSGNETQELIDAKEYLKDIQMTINIGDVSDSLFSIEDVQNLTKEEELNFFINLKESIFSRVGLNFLEKVKYLTSYEGISIKALENVSFESENNFVYLNQNLVNHCKEFITAIWDSILLIKIAQSKNQISPLIKEFNDYFAQLTKIKTGNKTAYVRKEDSLDMVCELTLFMQYYISDFLIYLIKSEADISTKDKLERVNKEFIEILKKSKKIEHRLQMLGQIKSNNYQLLLKLLVEQKNSEIRAKPFVPKV